MGKLCDSLRSLTREAQKMETLKSELEERAKHGQHTLNKSFVHNVDAIAYKEFVQQVDGALEVEIEERQSVCYDPTFKAYCVKISW